MKTEKVILDGFILIGTAIRTNNKDEMNSETAKIEKHFHSYFSDKLEGKFKDHCEPCVTYSVYTEFESDENGEYTHFIGGVAKPLDNQDLSTFKKLIVPASQYQKFITDSGQMPNIVIEAWQNIWQMKVQDFLGKRAYVADFEVYDHRASDPNNAIVDIYIGIENTN